MSLIKNQQSANGPLILDHYDMYMYAKPNLLQGTSASQVNGWQIVGK